MHAKHLDVAPDQIQYFKDVLNQDINNIGAAIELGNRYYDLGDAAQAILYYSHALQIDPAQPGVRTDMGTMFWKNGNVSLAEKAFRDVIRDFPNFCNAYLNLGSLVLHAKLQPKEAHILWTTLIEKFPNDPAASRARQFIKDTSQ